MAATITPGNDSDSEHELWIALLLSDGSFPGGALANSQGLEAAMAHGMTPKGDEKALRSFARMTLEQAAHQSLPFVLAAHALGVASRPSRANAEEAGAEMDTGADVGASAGADPDAAADTYAGKEAEKEADALRRAFLYLDSYLHASMSSDVARQASANQGKCFARVVREAFPHIATTLARLLSTAQGQAQGHIPRVRCHFAPVFGLCCGLLGLRSALVCRLFLRCLLRDLLGAAVRLGLAGPILAVGLQAEAAPAMERLALAACSFASASASASASAPVLSAVSGLSDSYNAGSDNKRSRPGLSPAPANGPRISSGFNRRENEQARGSKRKSPTPSSPAESLGKNTKEASSGKKRNPPPPADQDVVDLT